jgi:hypothetical protein
MNPLAAMACIFGVSSILIVAHVNEPLIEVAIK